MVETKIKVEGMSCGHCKMHVTEAISGVAGVSSVDVDLDKGEAKVSYDENATDIDAIKKAVNDSGYKA
ncbi:heavy-metal-associated domain-containing protein [Methanococcoides alaskense]|uniref:Copper chaperone n=1 Tax=Methanococcoides alaskense TaxID=325778 RepID=A0AA90U132_9EURY|nr:copper ion binding protein [Methanococcoides alaskense]MDA0524352.1 copper ion binding protein [Methanococcoides alaskense]MDR6223921.1 copper chaperone [Methanococcoides alaskense]